MVALCSLHRRRSHLGPNGNAQHGGHQQSAALRSRQTKMHESINAFDDNLVVIYNRVPKTGSTSFINLAYDLCKKNHFYVLHINITANMHVLSLNNQVIGAIFVPHRMHARTPFN